MNVQPREFQNIWRAHSRDAEIQSIEPDIRIGLSGSFTIDPLIPYLGAHLLEGRYRRPEFLNANYNQVMRVCYDPSSEFGSARLNTLIMLWRIEDLGDPANPANLRSARDSLLQGLQNLRETYSGTIIVALPPRPRPFVEGLAEFARSSALTALWFDTLVEVERLVRSLNDCYTVDLEAVIADVGTAATLDRRKELLYRQPYSESFYLRLAEALSRILRARTAEAKKCLVLDCDNTLWGGVIGEDGVGGVDLSDDFPGRAFREFQSQISVLRRSGIFIALNSKNNPDDVWDMFDNNDAMLLRKADISSSRINWRPKSENLKEIAAELNIGVDSLVFVDDSRFEIEEVRAHAPEVTTFLVPEELGDLPDLMFEIARCFDRLTITDDDRARVDMMHQETARRDLAQKMTEEEFLGSLGLEVFVQPATPTELARVTQLVNKTNQFNVTTRRYSQDEVSELVKSPDSDVYCVTVKDRFGDYGLVGVGIIKHGPRASEVDSFLMSCRVLGRGVETVMMSHAIDLARKRGVSELHGQYLPTPKNAMVADLFSRHGFEQAAEGAAEPKSATAWRRASEPLPLPGFLTVHNQ